MDARDTYHSLMLTVRDRLDIGLIAVGIGDAEAGCHGCAVEGRHRQLGLPNDGDSG